MYKILKIGLTGGIGCGKSTVANYFAKLKVPIIDADKIVHRLLKHNPTVYKKILSHFGKEILTTKKAISRKKLRKIIFSNDKERIWLEKMLHPLVYKQMWQETKKVKAHYCILVIPLLFETTPPFTLDRILLVDCTKKNQIARSKNRDQTTTKHIKKIIDSQVKKAVRRRKADDIIYNNNSLEQLKKKVRKLHDYYLSLT